MKISDTAYVERNVQRSHSLSLSLALALALAPSPSHAQTTPTLDSVLTRFSRIQGLTLHFREEKHIALLTLPLITEGSLAYSRPGRLARRAGTETVLIDGSALRMSDGSHEQHIDLGSQPIVRSFVDSFRALLAGDRAAIERSYVIEFASTAATWSITLRPRGAPLNQFLVSLEFHGQGDALVSMTMNETSGDTTTTTFSDIDDHHHFTSDEAARVFALP